MTHPRPSLPPLPFGQRWDRSCLCQSLAISGSDLVVKPQIEALAGGLSRRTGAPTVPLRGDRRRTRIPKVKDAALVGRRPRPLAPQPPCHVPTRPGWPRRTTLLLPRHPPRQPGQAETAAAGGADRRPPRTRPRRMDQSSTGCSAISRRTGGVGRWSPTSYCRVDRGDRTRSGLRVQAALDQDNYQLGVRVSERELAAVPPGFAATPR
jgi:hypothetical protein